MAGILKLAVLASGEGTTFVALAAGLTSRAIASRIVLMISDRPGALVLARAAELGIPAEVLPSRGVEPAAWSRQCGERLQTAGVDLVVLAGYLAILPAPFLAEWAGRVINLHPALLPRHAGPGMYGARVHRSVLAAGDPETGATVHLVTEAVDAGPILWQLKLPVNPGDTPERLRERLRPLETEALLAVVERFADGRWPLPARTRPG